MAERAVAGKAVISARREEVDYLAICDRVVLVGIALAFVGIPLAFGGLITNDMFDLPKLVLMRVATIVVATAWVVRMLIAGELSWRRTPLDLPALAFLVANILATIHTVSPNLSIHGEYRRYEGILTIGNYVVLFYLAANLIPLPRRRTLRLERIEQEIAAELDGDSSVREGPTGDFGREMRSAEERSSVAAGRTPSPAKTRSGEATAQAEGSLSYFQMLLFGQVGAGVVVALYAICQRFGLDFVSYVPTAHQLPMISTYGNVNFLAAYLGMVIPISLALFLSCSRPVTKAMLMAAAAVMTVVVFLTTSRAAWLGVAFGVILLLVLAGRLVLRRNLLWLAPAVVLLLAAPVLNWSTVVSRVEETARVDQVGSAQYRLRWWGSSLPMIADNLVLGTGVSTLEVVFPKYASIEYAMTEGKDTFLDKAHNEFIHLAATTGVVGLGAYLSVLGALTLFVWRTWRKKNLGEKRQLYLAGLVSAVLVYLVQNQFSFGVIGISSLFWMMLGMIVVLGGSGPKKALRRIRWPLPLSRSPRLIVGLASVLVAAGFLFFTGEMALADNLYREALKFEESGQFDQAQTEYQRIVALNSYQTEYWRGLGTIYLDRIKAADSGPAGALQASKQAWFDEAVKMFEKVVDLNPAPFDYLFLAQTYAQWDPGQDGAWPAFQNYKLAVQGYPYYYYGNLGLGQVAYQLGMYKDAAQAYQIITLLDPSDINARFQLAYSYSELGQDDEASAALHKIVSLDPGNYLAHFHLGVIYQRRGNRDRAIQELQAVLNTRPADNDVAQYEAIKLQAEEALKRLGL